MKKHMKLLLAELGIELERQATNDQFDPQLNEISVWFREQYRAYIKAKKVSSEYDTKNTNVVSLFQAYHKRVYEQVIEKCSDYDNRLIEIASNYHTNPSRVGVCFRR